MNKSIVLVTGGNGYIGAVVVDYLLMAGFKVRVFDLTEGSACLSKIRTGVEFYAGSICDSFAIQIALKDVKSVIHLAGISDGRAGKENPSLTSLINVQGTSNLLKCCKDAGVENFFFSSTMGVYGSSYKRILCEDLRMNPEDPYSISKMKSEFMIRNFSDSGMKCVILRLAMVYGVSPSMRHDFIIHLLIKLALTKKSIKISGGCQRRPQIHIEDVADCIVFLLMKSQNGEHIQSVYNLVSSNPSINELATTISKKLPGTELQFEAERENESSFVMSNDRIIYEGFSFKKDLGSSIDQLIQYYHLNGMD